MSSVQTSSTPAFPQSLNRVVITHYISAALGALLGCAYMLFGIFGFFEGSDEGIVGGLFIMAIGFFVMVLNLVLHLLTARGLKRMSNGWRIVSIILSILSLFSFLIGTILGIVALTGLFAQDTQQAFASQKK